MSAAVTPPSPGAARRPLISVAMPVYNGAAHLAEAIESVLAQSCADFELIIIDDGSTDDSLQLLRAFEQKDSRIRLISRENRNLATTLNDIIALARGTWIARMDQDDIALPERFERQLAWLRHTGADICGTWVRLFGASDTRVLTYPASDAAIRTELLFASPFAHPTVMMRAVLAKQLPYDKAWEKCEDYELWERAADAGWAMSNVQEVLLMYRQHPSQITSQTGSQNQVLAQQVRRRRWARVGGLLQLEQSWIDAVNNIRAPRSQAVDIDHVDRAFAAVLGPADSESRAVAFAHMTNLYYLLAGEQRGVAARWGALNRQFGLGFARATQLKLWLLGTFGVRADGAAYRALKVAYLRATRSRQK